MLEAIRHEEMMSIKGFQVALYTAGSFDYRPIQPMSSCQE